MKKRFSEGRAAQARLGGHGPSELQVRMVIALVTSPCTSYIKRQVLECTSCACLALTLRSTCVLVWIVAEMQRVNDWIFLPLKAELVLRVTGRNPSRNYEENAMVEWLRCCEAPAE
mmetsp:Transcript_106416/g.185112  ORF Transcript_106416/g.185112 Transcript_106416/m.185112 type:complete len:116 (+) Transcript_106416:200-547(+)